MTAADIGLDDVPTPKVQAIRDLIAAGRTLIPVNGKIPTQKNWGSTKPGAYDETSLPLNYGVVLGDGDLVIDVDPRNFKKGDRPLARLIKDTGLDLKDTYVVYTGGGGLHAYLTIPLGVLVVNDLKEYPGIEFKSVGRQVVGPGSIHPDSGKPYFVKKGAPGILVAANEKFLALIKRTAVPFAEIGNGTGAYKSDAGTQGRFVDYLKNSAEPSIERQNGDNNAFKVAAAGRDLALPPQITWELMLAHWNERCVPPWDAEELKTKVIHAYKYAGGSVGSSHPAADFKPVPVEDTTTKPKDDELVWNLTNQGAIIKGFYNLLNYLKLPSGGLNKVFGFNEFTGAVEFKSPAPWHQGRMPAYMSVTDNDLKQLKGFLAVRHAYEMPVQTIEEAVVVTAQDNRFHPVREYLTGLKWDGKPRLDTWLQDYLSVADSVYVRACSRKVLCAAVMRVMRPGVKFDHVLVLEGAQGVGKSSVCKILGGEWSGDFAIDPHNKDTVQSMQGTWVLELAEMEVTRRAEMDALKSFLSRSTDKVRMPYGRLAVTFPRQSIFIASKNPGADGTYLKDDTGNRRWWPVECNPISGQFDFKGLKAARSQLFAEAMHIVTTKGEQLYMDTDTLKAASKDVVDMRHADHPWTEHITNWIEALRPQPEVLTAREIFTEAFTQMDVKFGRRAELDIAGVMRNLGWKHGLYRVAGAKPKRGYKRPAVEGLDILGDLV